MVPGLREIDRLYEQIHGPRSKGDRLIDCKKQSSMVPGIRVKNSLIV